MDILLVRPHPGNERFGLGPFFRVEPLGLEYVAAALRDAGARPSIVDARFERRGHAWMRRHCASIVGISCMHAMEYDCALEVARAARRLLPGALVVIGGHAASALPGPLETADVDAICVDDGEIVLPAIAEAVAAGRSLAAVPGLRLRTPDGWISTPPLAGRAVLDRCPRPARDLVARYRRGYHCLLFRPVWLVETARGCPYRCSFCSVWSLYGRSYRDRSIGTVAEDLEAVGENVFIVDDLFWNLPDRSLALARELRRRGVRKRWILVQTRTDLVRRHPELLEAWRPLATDFDIFFGLEAPTDAGLGRLSKDATLGDTVEAARIARGLRYGVTGNFVIDPDWSEDSFRELWEFVAEHRFERAGYTILTPLPGTALHRDHDRLRRDRPWFTYDMHHALWEPRLGARRFFELYAETWRRSILNLKGRKRWRDWIRQVRLGEIPYLTRVLLRTQRMMRADAYLDEHAAAAGPQRSAATTAVSPAGPRATTRVNPEPAAVPASAANTPTAPSSPVRFDRSTIGT